MDLSVTFLGTGGPVPTALRNTASVLITRGGEKLMFDCGEGTQRQMRCSVGLTPVDQIYLTHFHLDHCLGLPGLLKTYDLGDRTEPMRIFGPAGLEKLLRDWHPMIGRLGYHLEVEEVAAGDVIAHDGYEIEVFKAEHSAPNAVGYAMLEDDRPGRFDPEVARELGVSEGPDFKLLQSGQTVTGSKGEVRPDQVMDEDRFGRAIVLTGDTGPCQATVIAAADADLLIHDSSFMTEDIDRAAETGHSTSVQAAEVAEQANVKLLALVHISSRYHVGASLDEARETFENVVAPRDFDQIVVPFPERGEPELVRDGARKGERPPPEPEDSANSAESGAKRD